MDMGGAEENHGRVARARVRSEGRGKTRPGISFLMRIRDEEATLDRSLESLVGLAIPHTIHAVLHRCTDGSEAIARRRAAAQPIEIVHDEVEVSRAGYETLVTPRDHEHSLVAYYNRCFRLATRAWIFKWDADFVATPALVSFLNTSPLFHRDHGQPTSVLLSACFEGVENRERYLSNCLLGYGKHVFWEVPRFDAVAITIDRTDLRIDHASPLSVLKPYWRRPAWFTGEPSIQGKHARLVELAGPEPEGCARASNPACAEVFRRILGLEDALRAEGILLYE